MTNQPRRFAKLSAFIDGASRRIASTRLADLRRIIIQAREIAQEMATLGGLLARGTAEANQPFLFTPNLSVNESQLRKVFTDCQDVVFHRFTLAGRAAQLIYIDGLCDKELLERGVLQPLLSQTKLDFGSGLLETLARYLTVPSLDASANAGSAIQAVLMGSALIMVDGIDEVVTVEAAKYAKRAIEEPKSEGGNVRGPQDAFNETLKDGVALLRRRLANADLKVHYFSVGYLTKTRVAIVYVSSLVKPGLVETVEQRLASIQTDAVFFSATIGEFLANRNWSPFPQIFATERPETVAMGLCEGRVGILVDNTPFAILVPCTFTSMLQTSDDYTLQPIIASLIRITRHISAVMAIFLMPLYIAMISFHPGTLPVSLAISIAELRAKTPFPTLIEVLFMEGLLEIFQESIVRLPIRLSGAASMLGAFVIGNTVVQAGLINPLLVVATASTAIASYTMPSHNLSQAMRWLRIPAIFAAAVLGLYGIALAWLVMVVHACSLRSFGESFLGDLFNVTLWQDWKDNVVRLPAALQKTRPKVYGAKKEDRSGIDNA
ncbi:MAG: GerA spore germination protein [Anaerosporomusa subterranea]|jgi:spore germination protein KA/spore germination protein|nr:GerA spore germination protein [Anaerosporomusa subterranea]